MKAHFFALTLFALATPLPGASVNERLDRLESQISEIQRMLRKVNQATIQPSRSSHTNGGYTVKSGDSFWSIARRHGVSVSALERANPRIDPRRMQIGKHLTIPGAKKQSTTTTPVSRSDSGTYTVKSGDILGRISEAHGIRLHQLLSANPGLDARRLKIGTVLNIPSQTQTVSTPPRKKQVRNPEPIPSPRGNPYLESRQPEVRRVTREVPKLESQNSRLVQISRDSRLTEIAQHYRTTVAQLNKLNNVELSPQQMIQTGSQLYVPGH